MKFPAAAVALISLLPAVLGLTVNTPTNVVVCQPVLLTWGSGTPPYYLTLIPAGQVSAAPIYTFPTQTGTQLTWVVNLQANTNFNIALKDNTGATAYSDIVTVQAGSDISCLNGSTIVSSPSNTNTGSTNTNTGTTNPSGGSGGGNTKTSTTSSPSSSGSSSGNKGGASGLTLSSFGVAGVIGAVAALF